MQHGRRTVRELRPRRPADEPEEPADLSFAGLHALVAGMYLASGAEAALGERRGEVRAVDALRWGPLVAAPIAALTHAARALAPCRATRIASRIANGMAVVVGAAGLASSVACALDSDDASSLFGRRRRRVRDRIPSLAPLAFGVTGLLGEILEREEQTTVEEIARLEWEARRAERRARIVERLTPRRRARVDRIVVHA